MSIVVLNFKGIRTAAEFATIAGFLCLIFVGCGRKAAPVDTEDARLTRQIVGAWTITSTTNAPDSNGYRASFKSTNSKATNYFRADGSYSFVSHLIQSNVEKTFNYEATWVITNKDLVLTVTKSSEPKGEPVGKVYGAHIIQLNAERMVYDIDGQTIAWARIE